MICNAKKKKNVTSLLFLSRFSVALTMLKTPLNWSCAKTSFTLYFKTQKRLGLIWIFWEISQCPQTSSWGVRQPIASLSWQFWGPQLQKTTFVMTVSTEKISFYLRSKMNFFLACFSLCFPFLIDCQFRSRNEL